MIKYFKRRWDIFSANLVNTFQQEVAYFANNLGSVFSTVFYTGVMLLFINILYSNVSIFAGYAKNDMLFLFLMGQVSFYALWKWSRNNLRLLSENVRNGNMDFVLTRPLPALFYVTIQEVYMVSFLRDSMPNLIFIAVLINWKELNLVFFPVTIGIIIWILGHITWHCFCFLFALPVFWQGETKQVFRMTGALEGMNDIPFEAFENPFKTILITIIPSIICAQLSVSVMLGKSNGPKMLALSAIVAIIFISLKIFFWKLALKNYTSASS